MAQGWQAVAELWRHRHVWLWPLLLAPLLVVAIVMSRPQEYLGTVTLQLDQARVSSPLLQDWSKPANREVLAGVLRRRELLEDTGHAVNATLDAKQLDMQVLSDKLLRIGYRSASPEGLDTLVGTLATNFIYELLAPERLRLEQQLATVGRDLRQVEYLLGSQTAAGAAADPSATVVSRDVLDFAQLRSQQAMLQTQYRQVLSDLSLVNAVFDPGSPHDLLWPAEPVRVLAPAPALLRLLAALVAGLGAGIALAGMSLLIAQRRREKLALAEHLPAATGESLAGHLPDLGAVMLLPQDGKTGEEPREWHAAVSSGTLVLDPTGFTEVSRLHRALTRNLHGALLLLSSGRQEGTTLLAALLGLRSSSQGKPTLLVDLNLLDMGLTKLFEARPAAWGAVGSGRSKTVTDDWQAAVVPLGRNLSLLPAPNDAATIAALQNGKILPWLDRLTSHYEHIIFDTTPVTALNRQNADPLALAGAMRTALLVDTGRTTLVQVQQTLGLLRQHGVQLAGLVANDRHSPDDKTVLLSLCRAVGTVAPALAQWLRAKVLRAVAV